MCRLRIGARNDAGTWTDSAWQDLTAGWNALEVDWQAAHDTGSLRLWAGGTLKATLSAIDNDSSKIDSVRLGAQDVDTGTRGTIYFDDFESRRFSEIGLLPDPGIQNPTPTPVPGWDNVSYAYGDTDHVHAVTGLSNGSTYTYDANGNQICRYDRASIPEGENSKYYKQEYNAENRLYQVTQRTGSCSGTVLAT